jgi:hypothetical protein
MIPESGRRIKTRISPDFLDTIGKSFKFKHGKGVAEWLKNSLDQYLRSLDRGEESLTGSWPVFISLIDGANQVSGPNLAVIDWAGTTYQKIEQFFLYWGDTSAATHGGTVNDAALTGGHGNGGKFYMREMWRDGARFLTWKRGKATSLVVKKMPDGITGIFEIENVSMNWRDALETALSEKEHLGGSDGIIQYFEAKYPQLLAEIENQSRGFSVVVGRRVVQSTSANDVVVGGKWRHQQLVDDIREAQQARRPIRELSISVFVNGQIQIERLTPQLIEKDPEWESEESILTIPESQGASGLSVNDNTGFLTIHKSANQLAGRLKDLNALFITDDNDGGMLDFV